FDEIGVKRAGFPNSGESVLGGVAGGSPMTDAKDGGDSDLARDALGEGPPRSCVDRLQGGAFFSNPTSLPYFA
ncbi:MAG TPA: hypothetical protein PK614_09925, partial [Nitrospira sp.]|nr:hypothetical protein [Nitrospira sp.]